jgi:hypothetical protein
VSAAAGRTEPFFDQRFEVFCNLIADE